MTKRIDQLDDTPGTANTPLPTDLIEIERPTGADAGSYKTRIQSAVEIVQYITTGADPVAINPEVSRVILTTSGIKTSEIATLDLPSDPSTAYGRIMTVSAILTGPADEPEIDSTNLENVIGNGNFQFNLHIFSGYPTDLQPFVQLIFNPASSKWRVLTPLYAAEMSANFIKTWNQSLGIQIANDGDATIENGILNLANRFNGTKGSGTIFDYRVHDLPTADPADGNDSVWMDPITRQLKVGT